MTEKNINPQNAFGRLQELVGHWVELNGTTTVDFRISAYDSILVETWKWPEKNIEALTIYHLDDERLIATHYCPIGNQPRLEYIPDLTNGRLSFEFSSATNLPDKKVDHCESFWFEFDGVDRFTRSETYEENGVPETIVNTYERAKH